MGANFNYLVVSDLHLRGGFHDRTEGLYHFDEEFADFLRYYRLNRAPTRPWQLIIAGDFIEFLYVTDLPDPTAPLLRGASFSADERRYGASTEPHKSRWKLDTILRGSHPQLLLALARFLAEGNHVVVLRGNHDGELFWPEVQEHFRRLVTEHHPANVGYLTMKETVAQRLQFAPWFWHVPGLLYAEHGCQYDPFCSFEYFLNPVLPADPHYIASSISDLSVRYFANQVKLLDAMAVENLKSISQYIWWVARGNRSILARAVRLYGGMVRRILAKSGRPDPETERAVRTEHERRLKMVDERFGLQPGTAAAVDALHATPIMRRPSAAARFLCLDLFIVGGMLAASAGLLLATHAAGSGLLVLLGGTMALGLLFHIGAVRIRQISDAARLQRTAGRIAELFRVPYVLLGHTHQGGTRRLQNGSTYFNVGTWVPLAKDAYFVYAVLTADGGAVTGALWRWNKRKAAPEPFGGAEEC